MLDVIKETVKEDFVRASGFVILTITVGALVLTHQTVPGELWAVYGAVIGYFFGRGVTNGKSKSTDQT